MHATTINQLPEGNKVPFTETTNVAYEDYTSNSIRKISISNLLKQLPSDLLIKELKNRKL